ncbi:hypothetical protein V3C99_001026 [Haemonchus contortus]
MNRAILSLCRQAPVLRRALHKGVDSTPPMRWTSIPERVINPVYAHHCVVPVVSHVCAPQIGPASSEARQCTQSGSPRAD